MAETRDATQETGVQENREKNQGFMQKFTKFLMYGGFLIILFLAGLIFVLVDKWRGG